MGCQTDWQLPPVDEYIPVLVGGPGQDGHGDPPFLAARVLDSQEAMVDPGSSTPAVGPYTGDTSSEVMGLLGAGAVPNSDTESDFEQVQDRAKKTSWMSSTSSAMMRIIWVSMLGMTSILRIL